MVVVARLAGEGVRHRGYFRDPFDRTDRAITTAVSPPYSTSSDPCNIVATQAQFPSGTNASWVSIVSTTYSVGPNQFAELEVTADLAGDIAGVFCRYQDDNNFYIGRCDKTGSDTYQVYKRIGATYTLLASLVEAFPQFPFSIRLEVNGASVPTLRMLVGNGSQWIQKVSTTDAASARTSGQPGFFGQRVAGNVTVDNFAFGVLGG